jgi:hypothetical protein
MTEARMSIITLTTDFGSADHYVGAVKGAILSVAPQAVIVDITHDVPAHDVREAAWVLRNAIASFPKQTVHVAVVDPGVGSARRPILASTENHHFIGPDNGIFSWVFESEPPRRVVEISAPHYMRSSVSSTFHARDIFGPAAAHLARGTDPGNFGETIEDYAKLDLPRARLTPEGEVRASVAHVDRFGNVVLNLTRTAMEQLMARAGATGMSVAVGAVRVEAIFATYAEAPAGAPFLLYNSSDFLEIAANQGRAADILKVRPGDAVAVTLRLP